MKDITPPKLAPAAIQPSASSVSSSVAKQLYPMSPLFNSFNKTTEVKTEIKPELSDLSHVNRLLSSSVDSKLGMSIYFLLINAMFYNKFYSSPLHQLIFCLEDWTLSQGILCQIVWSVMKQHQDLILNIYFIYFLHLFFLFVQNIRLKNSILF